LQNRTQEIVSFHLNAAPTSHSSEVTKKRQKGTFAPRYSRPEGCKTASSKIFYD